MGKGGEGMREEEEDDAKSRERRGGMAIWGGAQCLALLGGTCSWRGAAAQDVWEFVEANSLNHRRAAGLKHWVPR
jgi:hypothetical protein